MRRFAERGEFKNFHAYIISRHAAYVWITALAYDMPARYACVVNNLISRKGDQRNMVITHEGEREESIANREVLRAFIAHEYAFVIETQEKVFHIGHYKGSWSIVQIMPDGNHTFLTYADSSDVDSNNPLIVGLAHEVISKWPIGTEFAERDVCAKILTRILEVWLGNFYSITRITVKQAGRNSTVDTETGEFRFFNP